MTTVHTPADLTPVQCLAVQASGRVIERLMYAAEATGRAVPCGLTVDALADWAASSLPGGLDLAVDLQAARDLLAAVDVWVELAEVAGEASP